MSQSTSVAIQSARVWLHDEEAISWTDSILLSKLQEAHRELLLELRVHSIPVIKTQSARITVPPLTIDMYAAGIQPSDLVQPLELLESDVGANIGNFSSMMKTTFLPMVDQTNHLIYWAWQKERILLIGATDSRDVIIRYKATVVTPVAHTDLIGFIMGELYLGPRTAAICLESQGRDASVLNERAKGSLWKIVQANTVEDQRPVRRRRYRSSKSMGTFGGGISIPVGSGMSGGASVYWILPSNLPNGVDSVFRFAQRPKFCTYNGLVVFEGIGYTVTFNAVTRTWDVTFIDSHVGVLTPDLGDDVRAEIN